MMEGMCDDVRDSCTDLFTREVEEKIMDHIAGQITVMREQNAQLLQELSYEEFTIVVKKMHPDKASERRSKQGYLPKFLVHHGSGGVKILQGMVVCEFFSRGAK